MDVFNQHTSHHRLVEPSLQLHHIVINCYLKCKYSGIKVFSSVRVDVMVECIPSGSRKVTLKSCDLAQL